jgi:fermentation-respiration switch protein FrsA (DUF1100 family)
MSEAALEAQQRLQQDLFEFIQTESDTAKIEEYLKGLLDDEALGEGGQAMKSSAAMQSATVNSAWFRFFLQHDPAPVLQKVSCPVLALNGERDLQVSPAQNLPVLEQALQAGGNQRVTVHKLPDLNHLFQHCQTGAVSEYGQIEETFNPAALELIGDWILENFGPDSP